MAKGGYKGSSPARETSPEEYSGVWDIVEQYDEQNAGSWPFQKDDCAPKSLRLNSSDAAYLGKTFTADGDRRVWTWSCWFKKHKNGANQQIFGQYRSSGTAAENRLQVYFNTSDQLQIHTYSLDHLKTNRVFRDNSAWTHLVLTLDTTNSIANNRVRLYINGIEETSFATRNNPSLSQELGINTNGEFNIGTAPNAKSTYYSDVTLSEVHFIDGQPLSCEEFGFFDGQGIWQPKRFTGSYSSGLVHSNNSSTLSDPLNAFDGSISTFSYVNSSGALGEFTGLSIPTPANSTMRVRVDSGSDGNIKLNGSNAASFTGGAAQWVTVTSANIPSLITSIGIQSSSGPGIAVVELNGVALMDATVGRNSFHLDFSDGVKDQSGLSNDWTASNIDASGDGPASNPVWESGDSGWTIASGGGSATEGGVNGYQDVFTGLLEVGKIYAFTTSYTNGDQNGGWFFADSNSTSLSGTHPNQGRGSNSIGQRGRSSGHSDVDKAGAHGTFATANGVTAGDSNLSGFTVINPEGSDTINWVVDRVKNKVWVKRSTDSAWIQGGNPSDGDSAPSFHLPSTGDLYFGFVQYNNNNFTISIAAYSFTASGRAIDILVDSPVNGLEASTGAAGTRRGNYCTMNPLKNSLALSDGNLKVTGTSGWKGSTGTIGMSSGQWYWEYGDVVSNEHIIGIVKTSFENPSSTVGTNDGYGYGSETGGLYDPVGGSNQSYGSSWTTGDTIGIAFDADKGNLYFYKNGTIQNSGNPAFTGLTDGPYVPSVVQNGSSRSAVLNFGQLPFKYQNAGTDRPSTDYKPLATSFLPEPTIKRGDEAFDIALWTGNGASQRVRYPRLNPDLIWLKERTNTSDHGWWNTLSGVAKYLSSNLTDDEFDTTTEMNSLNEDGFTVGSSTMTNESSQDYVGWAWAAGEATTTIGVGGSNSQAFDQSQRWRNNITSSNGWNTSYPVANIFNGAFDGGGGAANNGNGGTITFTPPAAITVTKLELSCYNDVTLGLPDGTTQTIAGVGSADKYVTADIGSGFSFTGSNSITISRGGGFIYFERIRINGKELVDDDITINTPEASCDVRANQKAGFSIIKVASPTSTQARVHGLSKAPELIICKSTGDSDSWHTYWKLLGRGYYINLNGSSGKSSSDQFGSQEANDISFYVKAVTGSGANKAGGMVYFAWHSVEGFSKFGEYTANNSASGPFVYCGFKPKLVLIWCHSGNEGRNLYDTERYPDNFNGFYLKGGDNNQEPTSNTESFAIDILSNGFKPRGQWGGINNTNTTDKYLFAAWAEEPFQSNCRAR